MRLSLSAMALLLASQAGAQTMVSMGRLFTTPVERAQLDAQRDQPPAGAPGARNEAAAAAGTTGAGAMGTALPCTPGAGPGCPTAGQAEAAAGSPGANAPADAAFAQSAQEAPGLRLDGVIRRSHGPTVVIVNGEVQPAPAGAVMRGTVKLQADGHSIVLKPGQRYDPATGEVHEAAR